MRYDTAIQKQVDALYRQNSLESHLRETPLLARVSDEGIQAIVAATQFESHGQFNWNAPYKKVSKQQPSERINAEPLIVEEGHLPQDLILIRSGFCAAQSPLRKWPQNVGLPRQRADVLLRRIGLWLVAVRPSSAAKFIARRWLRRHPSNPEDNCRAARIAHFDKTRVAGNGHPGLARSVSAASSCGSSIQRGPRN